MLGVDQAGKWESISECLCTHTCMHTHAHTYWCCSSECQNCLIHKLLVIFHSTAEQWHGLSKGTLAYVIAKVPRG